MSEEFIGKGLAFPMKTNPAGQLALVSREREIEEAMRLVLGTAHGERPMRPEFGCGIHDYVFSPADSTTAGRIKFEVEYSLNRWEPRIEVVDVVVTIDAGDRSIVYIDVKYALKGTSDPRSLVFPFYVIPEESGPGQA